jgi:hypothetical protein
MSQNMPLPPLQDNPFNSQLADAEPLLYAISNSGQWNSEEQAIINNLTGYIALDSKLLTMEDVSKARKEYSKFPKATQEFLKNLNPDADYQQQPRSLVRKILSVPEQLFIQPFREVLGGIEQFGKLVKSGYKATQVFEQSISKDLMDLFTKGVPSKQGPDKFATAGETMDAFKKTLTTKSWSDIYEGTNMWRDSSLKELENKYGYAASYLAKELIDGVKVSDIIRQYQTEQGQLDTPFVNAFQSFAENTPEWNRLYLDHKDKQINPGNDIQNFLDKRFPAKDFSPIWKSTLGTIPFIPVPVPEEDRWAVKNLGPEYKQQPWASLSGQVNFGYTLAIDPLMYLTFGGSKSAMAAGKLSQKLYDDNSLRTINDLFNNPMFTNKHTKLAEEINLLRKAEDEKDAIQAGLIKTRIATLHPEYDNDVVLNLFTKTKVQNDNLEEVFVTDLDTMRKFFSRGDMIHYITNMKVNGIIQQRAHHVALERRTRALTDSWKIGFDQAFNGIRGDVLTGKKPIPLETSKVIKAWEEYIVKDVDIKSIVKPDSDTLKTLTLHKNNLTKAYNRLFAKLPANKPIYHTDEGVDSSLTTFRQLARFLTGDKLVAGILAEKFKFAAQEDRLHTLKVMYGMYLDKIGLTSTANGVTAKRAILEGVFGSQFGLRTITNIEIPKHMDNLSLSLEDVGMSLPPAASQIFHLKPAISQIPFDDVLKQTYDLGGMDRPVTGIYKEKGVRGTLNIANNIAVNAGAFSTYNSGLRAIQTGWTGAVLLPKIGFKASFDHVVVGFLVNAPAEIIGLLNRKGANLSAAVQAKTGSKESQGLLKGWFLSKIGKNPAEAISIAERKALMGIENVSTTYTLESGLTVTVKESFPIGKMFEGTFTERVSRVALEKFTKLKGDDLENAVDLLTLNPHSIEGVTKSAVAATFANQIPEGSIAKELYGQSSFSLFLEEQGLKQTGRYIIDEANAITDSNRVFAHMNAFRQHFAFNKMGSIDFGSAFFTNNGLKTSDDVENFVTQLMGQVGWVKNSSGNYVAKGGGVKKTKDGKVIIDDKKSLERIKQFNGSWLKTSNYKSTGLTDAQISEQIIRGSMAEMYTIWHGSAKGFNANLIEALTMKINAVKKILGKDVPGETDLEKALRLKNLKEQATLTYQIDTLTVDEFAQLTKSNPLKGTIKTDIDFPELANTRTKPFEKLGKMGARFWEAMDKQIGDFYSSDIYMIKYLENRKRYKNFESRYYNEIREASIENALESFSKLTPKQIKIIDDSAKLQAKHYYNGVAQSNAMNEVLMYIDNPAIKNQIDFSARVTGRFIRATNDYARRLVRYMSQNPDQVIFRGGLYVNASNGTGLLYEDQNGTQYIMIPNDTMFWKMVAPTIASLANPLNALGGLKRGVMDEDWSFFKQPEWNQYTLKVSLLNPSYAEGAGMWTLVGPTIATPVLASKALIQNVSRSIDTKFLGYDVGAAGIKFSEGLDNWILGPQSDNTTWARALLPGNLVNLYNQLPIEQKEGLEVNIMLRALVALQSNPLTKVSGDDLRDDDKMQEFIERLRIASHNIVAITAGFNTLSPVPLGTTESGIPDALRKQGITTFNQFWGEVVRGAFDSNSENGFYLHDPLALATNMFIGQYPDKLVHTVSKTSKAAKRAINITKETKKWSIENRQLVERYPDAAWVFAPNIGEYDPGVISYLRASDILPPKENLFINNKEGLRRYITDVTAAKDVYQYYKIDKDVYKILNDPNNLERNSATYRRQLLAEAETRKTVMKAGNWALAKALTNEPLEQRQEQIDKFVQLENMIKDKQFIKTFPPAQLELLQTVVGKSRVMINTFTDRNVRTQFEGMDELEKIKMDGIKNIESVVKGNPALVDAYSLFIRPLLDELLSTPLKEMTK